MRTRLFDHTRIERRRYEAGVSRAELARRTCIPAQTLRQYERGLAKPSVDRLFQIAEALMCSADYFKTTTEEACSPQSTEIT
jgi:transcriptional regulator with XRE-family HTH domain